MSSDLIALVVAITLGIVVVVLGLRRNLSETTRNWLPRFGGALEPATATPGSSDYGPGRRPLSRRQRRWLASFYLLMALTDAASAVRSAGSRPLHAIAAGTFALGAVFLLRQGSSHPSGGSAS
jgi:hypothetical protein